MIEESIQAWISNGTGGEQKYNYDKNTYYAAPITHFKYLAPIKLYKVVIGDSRRNYNYYYDTIEYSGTETKKYVVYVQDKTVPLITKNTYEPHLLWNNVPAVQEYKGKNYPVYKPCSLRLQRDDVALYGGKHKKKRRFSRKKSRIKSKRKNGKKSSRNRRRSRKH